MGTTLTFGRYQPAVGETGFWDELNDNIALDDAHTHDGVDSAALPITSISTSAFTQTVTNAGWASPTNGIYSQVVTMPSGLTYDNFIPSFRDGTTKEILYITCIRASSNTFTIYSNDNTLALIVVYR
jgi:hypothetical protein